MKIISFQLEKSGLPLNNFIKHYDYMKDLSTRSQNGVRNFYKFINTYNRYILCSIELNKDDLNKTKQTLLDYIDFNNIMNEITQIINLISKNDELGRFLVESSYDNYEVFIEKYKELNQQYTKNNIIKMYKQLINLIKYIKIFNSITTTPPSIYLNKKAGVIKSV